MTTPITKQKKSKPVEKSTVARRDWCCGTPITGPHIPGCASEPTGDLFERSSPAQPDPPAPPEPPPTPPPEVPAAAQPRSYGFTKADEADLELPSGSLIRYRKLNPGLLLKLNLVEAMDAFTPELLADIRDGDDNLANDVAVKALTDPERNGKIFGPIDRIVAASVIIPTVVLVGMTTDTQVNIDDVELEDKFAIFQAAIGGQLNALKSVRQDTTAGA